MSYNVKDPFSIEEQQQQSRRIYLVTDGLKSPHTKRAYSLAYDHFIDTTVKSDDRRALLDTKQDVIESKIIDHITYLKDVQHISYLSIQVHLSGIFHFFEINDINLNTRKIKRFLPPDESEHYSNDRPYSVNEIERILAKYIPSMKIETNVSDNHRHTTITLLEILSQIRLKL